MSAGNKVADTNENIKKTHQYLKDHRIEEVLGDILNTIAHNRYDQPFVYMIKYLAKLVSEDELASHGIKVENVNEVNSIMQISYPTFEPTCNNLFKQTLSQQMYSKIKAEQTTYNNDLRHLINVALENQRHKIGVYSCDASCTSTFKQFFSQIHATLFPKIYPIGEDFQYQRYSKFRDATTILSQEMKYMEEFSIKIKRNIQGYAFNSTLKSYERQDIYEKLQIIIEEKMGRLFTQSFNISDLQSEDKLNISVQYNKLIKESAQLTRSGIRYREWPDYRQIFISQNKRLLIWINKEDHFELKCCCTGKEVNFIDQFVQCIEIIQFIDKQINFAFHQKEGFSTVKPVYSGLGIKFKVKVKLPSSQSSTFKANVEKAKQQNSNHFEIKPLKKDSNRWIIQLGNTFGIQSAESLLQQVEENISSLFQNIVASNSPPQQIHLIDLEQYSTQDQSSSNQQVNSNELTEQTSNLDSDEKDSSFDPTITSAAISLQQQQQQEKATDNISNSNCQGSKLGQTTNQEEFQEENKIEEGEGNEEESEMEEKLLGNSNVEKS